MSSIITVSLKQVCKQRRYGLYSIQPCSSSIQCPTSVRSVNQTCTSESARLALICSNSPPQPTLFPLHLSEFACLHFLNASHSYSSVAIMKKNAENELLLAAHLFTQRDLAPLIFHAFCRHAEHYCNANNFTNSPSTIVYKFSQPPTPSCATLLTNMSDALPQRIDNAPFLDLFALLTVDALHSCNLTKRRKYNKAVG